MYDLDPIVTKSFKELSNRNRSRFFVQVWHETTIGLEIIIFLVYHTNIMQRADKKYSALLYKVTSKFTGKNFVTNVCWIYL